VTKKSLIVLSLSFLLLGGAAALWQVRVSRVPAAARPVPTIKAGIVATPVDSHRSQSSLAADGSARARPADPELTDALSVTSRLAFALRLKTVHGLQAATLTEAQAAYLRAFIADPVIPEGLNIQQVRALKNDVLNVLCLYPGGAAATAATLRAFYADESQDAGLRDYALQHLVSLNERDPSLGWSAHWAAIDGSNPSLAATALLHLSLRHLQHELIPAERAHLEAAALRLAADTRAPDPARTTAIQVCGQLKLDAARLLALEVARSERTGMPLRIAAVATLGDLGGDTATRDYLHALTTGREKRLRIPAESALKRFSIN
jgi:hypothetical protein